MMSRFAARRSKREPVAEAEAELVTASSPPVGLNDLTEDSMPAPVCRVEVAHHTVKNWGGRHENEDRWMDHADSSVHKLSFHTVGVLDGHDTESASDTVSRLLPEAVSRRLKDGMPVVEAYEEAMAEMEEALKSVHATAGTCVNSCTIAGRFVWCANLGDCRSVLVPLQELESPAAGLKAAGLYWMSRDHKASAPSERRRIMDAGGTVVDGRVEGLEPSRTLGDFDVKLAVKKGVISIVPEVRRFELGDGQTPAHAILMCCTDGVWDVISGQDVCDLVHARKDLARLVSAAATGAPARPRAPGKPLQDLAEDVVQFAVARGSRDDCTCVVALVSALPRVGDAPFG